MELEGLKEYARKLSSLPDKEFEELNKKLENANIFGARQYFQNKFRNQGLTKGYIDLTNAEFETTFRKPTFMNVNKTTIEMIFYNNIPNKEKILRVILNAMEKNVIYNQLEKQEKKNINVNSKEYKNKIDLILNKEYIKLDQELQQKNDFVQFIKNNNSLFNKEVKNYIFEELNLLDFYNTYLVQKNNNCCIFSRNFLRKFDFDATSPIFKHDEFRKNIEMYNGLDDEKCTESKIQTVFDFEDIFDQQKEFYTKFPKAAEKLEMPKKATFYCCTNHMSYCFLVGEKGKMEELQYGKLGNQYYHHNALFKLITKLKKENKNDYTRHMRKDEKKVNKEKKENLLPKDFNEQLETEHFSSAQIRLFFYSIKRRLVLLAIRLLNAQNETIEVKKNSNKMFKGLIEEGEKLEQANVRKQEVDKNALENFEKQQVKLMQKNKKLVNKVIEDKRYMIQTYDIGPITKLNNYENISYIDQKCEPLGKISVDGKVLCVLWEKIKENMDNPSLKYNYEIIMNQDITVENLLKRKALFIFDTLRENVYGLIDKTNNEFYLCRTEKQLLYANKQVTQNKENELRLMLDEHKLVYINNYDFLFEQHPSCLNRMYTLYFYPSFVKKKSQRNIFLLDEIYKFPLNYLTLKQYSDKYLENKSLLFYFYQKCKDNKKNFLDIQDNNDSSKQKNKKKYMKDYIKTVYEILHKKALHPKELDFFTNIFYEEKYILFKLMLILLPTRLILRDILQIVFKIYTSQLWSKSPSFQKQFLYDISLNDHNFLIENTLNAPRYKFIQLYSTEIDKSPAFILEKYKEKQFTFTSGDALINPKYFSKVFVKLIPTFLHNNILSCFKRNINLEKNTTFQNLNNNKKSTLLGIHKEYSKKINNAFNFALHEALLIANNKQGHLNLKYIQTKNQQNTIINNCFKFDFAILKDYIEIKEIQKKTKKTKDTLNKFTKLQGELKTKDFKEYEKAKYSLTQNETNGQEHTVGEYQISTIHNPPTML